MGAQAQEPNRGALDQPSAFGEHRRLDRRRHLIVQPLDRGEKIAHLQNFTADGIGTRHIRRAHAGLLAALMHEGDANPVDDAVGHHRGDNLAVQTMAHDLLAIGLAQGLRKITDQVLPHIRIVRQIGREQFVVQRNFRIGEQDRNFGPGQADLLGHAFGDRLVIRQVLDGPVEMPGLFQGTHIARHAVEQVSAEGDGDGDRLGLQVVIAQDQFGDLIGHALEQLVALLARHVALGLHLAQQNLDVDLVVGAIDTRRVVNGIRIDVAAVKSELDTAALTKTQIGTLADDLAVQFVGIDPQRLVGSIAYFRMGFIGRLHIRADAAKP